ncbi:pirin family protein [Neptuniibacter halophilus]|uniref:pirin family protein n=1 Tax=Neptuniibacter halophilus TaxID=651666 RepID=UPI002572902F|nr:pirin family protein [Neptuniibacter halophilus]
MIQIRKSDERGKARYSWLDSKHSFSFGHYYDPQHMGISHLRVLNDDIVSPGSGFETHPHRDMEIISYVLEGSLEHRDTMGYHSILKAGDLQVMSAGSGIMHSEFNPSEDTPLQFLQIWIRPDQTQTKPRYFERRFANQQGLQLLASADGREDSLLVRQEISLYRVQTEQDLTYQTQSGREYYLHLARGQAKINGITLKAGDALHLRQEPELSITEASGFEALLFELPEV